MKYIRITEKRKKLLKNIRVYSKVRRKVIQRLDGIKFATLIAPNAHVSVRIKMGEGCISCGASVLTVEISVGSHVIINYGCTIGHDAVIKDFATIHPGVNVSGNTFLGECVEMGTGSQIIQGIKVGDGTIVGAGVKVVKDVPSECTAIGCPAKPNKFHQV